MFITVRYGDDQRQIFNPNCLNTILLSFIKKRCCCDPNGTIELSDEKGVVKNLRQFPQEYAKAYLKDREVLVLLRVENVETKNGNPSAEPGHNSKPVYKPLLASLIGNSDFMETLNPPRDEDSISEVSSKSSSRRRSSTFDMEDVKANSARGKSKAGVQSSAKKPLSKRGHRPPLRKTTTAS